MIAAIVTHTFRTLQACRVPHYISKLIVKAIKRYWTQVKASWEWRKSIQSQRIHTHLYVLFVSLYVYVIKYLITALVSILWNLPRRQNIRTLHIWYIKQKTHFILFVFWWLFYCGCSFFFPKRKGSSVFFLIIFLANCVSLDTKKIQFKLTTNMQRRESISFTNFNWIIVPVSHNLVHVYWKANDKIIYYS